MIAKQSSAACGYDDPGYPWDALRLTKKWSDVGDYIWIRLGNGATPEQLKRDLAEYVDALVARMEVGA